MDKNTQMKGVSLKNTFACSTPGPTKKGPLDTDNIHVGHACRQVLLVSTIWNTRHAAVEVCTKEMAPETRSCADADSFVALHPSGLEHDHKGVYSTCAALTY